MLHGLLVRPHIISLNWSADDWDMYEMEESAIAAHALNECIVGLVNMGSGRLTVEKEACRIMQRYAHCGANDSEPHRMLSRLLEELYK